MTAAGHHHHDRRRVTDPCQLAAGLFGSNDKGKMNMDCMWSRGCPTREYCGERGSCTAKTVAQTSLPMPSKRVGIEHFWSPPGPAERILGMFKYQDMIVVSTNEGIYVIKEGGRGRGLWDHEVQKIISK